MLVAATRLPQRVPTSPAPPRRRLPTAAASGAYGRGVRGEPRVAYCGVVGVPIARLSANDLTNLATDRGSVPMQIGAVLLLDEGSAPNAEELVRVIEQRLARVPR